MGLGATAGPIYLNLCGFLCLLCACVLVWDPSVLFHPSKSRSSSVERNAIYIFYYPLSLSHLSPSFPLSLALSDLIFQLFSSLIPPVLALLSFPISLSYTRLFVLVSFLSVPSFPSFLTPSVSPDFFLFSPFFSAPVSHDLIWPPLFLHFAYNSNLHSF